MKWIRHYNRPQQRETFLVLLPRDEEVIVFDEDVEIDAIASIKDTKNKKVSKYKTISKEYELEICAGIRYISGWIDWPTNRIEVINNNFKSNVKFVFVDIAVSKLYHTAKQPIPGCKAEIHSRSMKWEKGNVEVVGISGNVIAREFCGEKLKVLVAVITGTEKEIPDDLPEDLLWAFKGDKERTKKFVQKLDKLDVKRFRPRDFAEEYRMILITRIYEVSGDENFFCNIHPNRVYPYVKQFIRQKIEFITSRAW